MANVKQGVNPQSWCKHLRKFGKKAFNKKARKAGAQSCK